jgi:hypothetical protein
MGSSFSAVLVKVVRSERTRRAKGVKSSHCFIGFICILYLGVQGGKTERAGSKPQLGQGVELAKGVKSSHCLMGLSLVSSLPSCFPTPSTFQIPSI